MKILIIEDEIKTARELKEMIISLVEDVEIPDFISSVKAAVSWFEKNNEPDLIFSDIQLADGLCFEIFKHISINVPVIFCTAFNQYAINAFETNSIDYLLKPIEEIKLRTAIEKYNKIKNFYQGPPENFNKKIQHIVDELSYNHKSTLLVYLQDKIIPIKTEDIMFIHSSEGIVRLFSHNQKSYLINQTLEALEVQLSPKQFYRANRQFIINRDAIETVHQYFGRKLLVKLIFPTPENITISKIRTTEFLKWIEI
ncbi:MAG: DNA-binding response regulator [Chryseobacterium sp.]|nr:MAG: DNA-binding response regulator [Chryseobacterium sp.]